MKTSEQKPQVRPISLRLPDDLRKWLRVRAAQNDRSLNGEILAALKDLQKRVGAWHAAGVPERGH